MQKGSKTLNYLFLGCERVWWYKLLGELGVRFLLKRFSSFSFFLPLRRKELSISFKSEDNGKERKMNPP